MELTPEERDNWIAFKKRHGRNNPNVKRVKEIIEMSEAGASIKDIYNEVKGSRGDVVEIRGRGGRQGAY